MRAVSDNGPTMPNQPKPQAVENLFNLMKAVSTPDTLEHFETLYNACTIRYGDMKKQLAEDIIAFATPLRLKINELSDDHAYLQKVVRRGAERAYESASATMREVRHIIGFREF